MTISEHPRKDARKEKDKIAVARMRERNKQDASRILEILLAAKEGISNFRFTQDKIHYTSYRGINVMYTQVVYAYPCQDFETVAYAELFKVCGSLLDRLIGAVTADPSVFDNYQFIGVLSQTLSMHTLSTRPPGFDMLIVIYQTLSNAYSMVKPIRLTE